MHSCHFWSPLSSRRWPSPPSRRSASRALTPIRLYTGWNDVVYEGVSLPVEHALAGSASAVSVVWELDAAAQRWRVWSPDLPPAARTLDVLRTGELYFLQASSDLF